MIRVASTFGFLVLVFGILGTTTACNTVDGLGQDVSAAARGVKRSVFKSE